MALQLCSFRISRNKIFILLLGVSIYSPRLFSQTSTIEQQSDSIELLENIHLHLNKTRFVKGERIWFSAYVQNKVTSKPSLNTQLLRVGLYDKNGNPIKHAAIHIQEGFGQGYIRVDSLLKDSRYYVLAYTNYMRNFKELKPFLQTIDLPNNQYSKQESMIEPIRVEFLNKKNLVAEITNNIAFKITGVERTYIKDNSIGIVSSSGQSIKTDIALNEDNLGRFQMTPHTGENYSIKYELTNGESRVFPLPDMVNSGIDLQINSLSEKDLYLSLNSTPTLSNKKSFKDLKLSYLQNDGQRIIVSVEDAVTHLKIAKQSLPFGLNSITVSLKDSSLINRAFFNDFDHKKRIRTISVDHKLNASQDSVYIYLKNADAIEDELHLSLSALPAKSKAYRPMQSIYETFWLDAITLRNKNLYNKGIGLNSRKNKVDLDLSLMDATISAPQNISIEPETISFDYEGGFPIKGMVEDANLKIEYQMYGIGRGSNIPFFEELKYDGSFNHQGLVYKGDSLRLSIVDNLGNLRKPKVKLLPISKDSTAYHEYLMTYLEDESIREVETIAEFTPLVTEPDVTVLDEVFLQNKKTKNVEIPLNTALVVGKRIGDEDIKRNPSFSMYMRRQGYGIRPGNAGKIKILSKIPKPGAGGAHVPIVIIINGMAEDNKEFYDFPLNRAVAVFTDMNGYLFVNVVFRNGFYEKHKEDMYQPIFLNEGLLPDIPYKEPGYLNTSSKAFKDYAALHWEAELVLDKNEVIEVVVPIYNQDSIRLEIEGMDTNGRLLHLEKNIELFKEIERQ